VICANSATRISAKTIQKMMSAAVSYVSSLRPSATCFACSAISGSRSLRMTKKYTVAKPPTAKLSAQRNSLSRIENGGVALIRTGAPLAVDRLGRTGSSRPP